MLNVQRSLLLARLVCLHQQIDLALARAEGKGARYFFDKAEAFERSVKEVERQLAVLDRPAWGVMVGTLLRILIDWDRDYEDVDAHEVGDLINRSRRRQMRQALRSYGISTPDQAAQFVREVETKTSPRWTYERGLWGVVDAFGESPQNAEEVRMLEGRKG